MRGLSVTAVAALASVSQAWMPPFGKIRGVNMGSLFVFEPWIASQEWNSMGCGDAKSEFDCVLKLGQDQADAAFQKHWDTWVTEDEVNLMASYDINTIRIPVGYWMNEALVDAKSEHFPRGGLTYLKRLCGWALSKNIYVIIDLHGAPAAQVASNPDTGQYAPSPGFYNDYQYGRAVQFLSWLTTTIHSTPEMQSVGMIELVNEPLNWDSAVTSLRSTFYKNAYDAIRAAESAIKPQNRLHVQMMGTKWGSGNPVQYLSSTASVSFDDHRYVKWDTSVAVNHASYISTSCGDDRNADTAGPTIVGEFSLSPPDNVQDTADWAWQTNKDFYASWFGAQVHAYEKWTSGWIFWTWKAQHGGDYRWSYKDAVAAGVIPKDLDSVTNPCSS